MGFARKRVGHDGKARYTAYYKDIKGRDRSAGTFPSKKKADKAWQRAESKLAEGRVGDPARGRMTFKRYVEETWLPNHQVEASTKQGYVYSLYKHIMPEFGPMRMIDILPEHVRMWITALKEADVSPATIKNNKALLSAVFTTALNDQVIFLHPCQGVKTPTVPVKPRTIITPEEFDTVYAHLPDDQSRLLVETAIETGLRWGELSELRVSDLNTRTAVMTVSRAVVQVNPKFHPEGRRFLVKEYPKDKEYRRFKISPRILGALQDHIAASGLAQGDLLFSAPGDQESSPPVRAVPDTDALGLTTPNAKGKRYRHGTLSAYSAGKCRCRHCKDAYTIYRAQRRSQGKDAPRTPRSLDTDGHIPRDWFRTKVWQPALKAAGLGVHIRMHDLRHAHASWVLAGGADLQVVKERLGHANIATTARYLHTLPEADDAAIDAFDVVRNRSAT